MDGSHRAPATFPLAPTLRIRMAMGQSLAKQAQNRASSKAHPETGLFDCVVCTCSEAARPAETRTGRYIGLSRDDG
ncbi:MAG: hypothetical protein OXU20_25010 [Myxococcales bacterium]|nr:hypothetical protein [Myxococcales bacterium]